MAERLTDEQFQAIQEKYSGQRLKRVMTPAGEFVLRGPTATEEAALQAQRFSGQAHIGIIWRNALVTLTVHPDTVGVQKALKDFPAMNLHPRVIDALRIVRGEADEEEGNG